MRIGLVLFGHLRSFRAAHGSYKSFLAALEQVGDVDVFCHTWDIEESVTASWWKEHKPGDTPPATVNASVIEEKYRPVRYFIEPSRQFDDSGYTVKTSIPVAGILSMLHSQREAFRLLEQYSEEKNIKYDIVIKSRYDLLYEIAPSFAQVINECLKNNCLYLPTSNPYELGGSYSDVFVIGPTRLVKDYFNFAVDFKNVLDRYQAKGYGIFLPEHCLTFYLGEKNIDTRPLTALRIHILRLSGDKFQINTDKNFLNNEPLCFFRDTILINEQLMPAHRLPASNVERVVKKYMSWIDLDANQELLQRYNDFYNGTWVGVWPVRRLATKGKQRAVVTGKVMKCFFEEALRNGNYGKVKKALLANILFFSYDFDSYFLRLLVSLVKNKRTPIHEKK